MYQMKTLSPKMDDISLPNCMYQMNNLCFKDEATSAGGRSLVSSDTNNSSVHVTGDAAATKEEHLFNERLLHNQYMQTCELIASQERLLIVLERVEAHLKSICKMIENVENVYNKDDGVQLPKHQENRQPQIEKHASKKDEIVINVHPSQAPYALIYLNILWKNSVFINIKTYLHSSLKSVGTEPTSIERRQISAFECYLMITNFKYANDQAKRINVLIIWKNCDKLSMLMSENGKIMTVFDEMNVLRYINRVILPQKMKYEYCLTCIECAQVDKVMDICYSLRYKSRDINACNKLFKLLSLVLQQEKDLYFAGDHCDFIDICVFSVLRQFPDKVNSKQLPGNIMAWYQRMMADINTKL